MDEQVKMFSWLFYENTKVITIQDIITNCASTFEINQNCLSDILQILIDHL